MNQPPKRDLDVSLHEGLILFKNAASNSFGSKPMSWRMSGGLL